MKKQSKKILAQKYATAYLNLFYTDLSVQSVQRIQKAMQWLEENHKILFLLKFPIVQESVKKNVVDVLCKHFDLPKSMPTLLDLLIYHRRSKLIPLVLKSINELYFKKEGIMVFTLQSSYPLTHDQKEAISHFLAQCTQRVIIYTWRLDKTLIAGIRVQSDTWLWEHSVRKQLSNMQLSLIR